MNFLIKIMPGWQTDAKSISSIRGHSFSDNMRLGHKKYEFSVKANVSKVDTNFLICCNN